MNNTLGIQTINDTLPSVTPYYWLMQFMLVLLGFSSLLGSDNAMGGKGGGGWYYNPPVLTYNPIPSATSISAPSYYESYARGVYTDTNGSWRVNWGSSSGATYYQLQESQGSGASWGTVYSGSNRNFTVSGKRLNIDYYYRVGACNSSGCAWSSSRYVRLRYVMPSSLSLSSTDADGNFNISWSAPGRDQTKSLQRRVGSGGWYDMSGTNNVRSKWMGNQAPGSYQYRLKTITKLYRFTCNYTRYWTEVLGRTPCSRVYTGSSTSYETAKSINVSKPFTPPTPSAPSNVTGNYTVSWGVGGNNPSTGYQLQQSINGGGYTTVQSSTSRSKGFSNVPGTYRYRVRGCRGGWSNNYCSSWSSVRTTTMSMATPNTPRITNKHHVSDKVFTLSWNAVRHANKYYVYRSSGGNYAHIATLNGNGATSYQPPSNVGDGSYAYKVRACYYSSCSGYSASANTSIMTAPATPSGLRFDSKGEPDDGSYRVLWNSQSGKGSITYYLYRSTASYTGSYGGESAISTTALNRTFNDGDGKYRYRVKACNTGGCSGYSGYIYTSVLAKPTTPSSFRLTDKDDQPDGHYNIRWNGQSKRVVRYEVYRAQASFTGSYGSETRIDKNSSTYHHIDNVGDGKYRYRVRAYNEAGYSDFSPYIEVKVLAKPTTPAGLRIADKANQSDGSYRVIWNNQSRRVTSYRLYRSQAAVAGGYGGESPITTSGLSVSQSNSDGDYRYRIKACNESGCSGLSGFVNTRVLGVPSVPTGLSIVNKDDLVDGSYQVRWNTQSRRVTRYELRRAQGSYNGSFGNESVSTHSTNAVNKSDGDGNYRYRVRACNETDCSGYTGYVQTQVLAVPAPPTSVSVPSSTFGAFNASIGYGSGLVQRIQLQHSVNNGAWGNTVNYNGKPTSQQLMRPAYTTGGALANYRFRVAACNDSDCSAYSSPSNSISINPPGTPSSISLSNVSHNSADADGNFDLNWSPITVVSGVVYDVEESTDGGSSWNRLITGTSNSSYGLQGKGQANYSYRVQACLAGIGCGDWTHPVQVKVATTPGNVGSLNLPATDTDGAYSLSWSRPSGTITHYQVEQNGVLITPNPSTTSRAFSSQSDGIYSYRVRACNDVVCSNYFSIDRIQVLRTPSVVLNVGGDSTSNNQGYFWLRWSAPTTGSVSQYQIKTSDSPHNSWSNPINNGTAIEKSFTKADGTYSYQVRACNQFSSEFAPNPESALNCSVASNTHQVTALRLPSTPNQPVVAATNTNGSYNVSWSKPSGTVDYYRLLQNGKSIDDNVIGQSKTLNDIDDGLYHYQIAACNDVGCSPYSSEASIEVMHSPSEVQNLTGDSISDGNGVMNMTWDAPATGQVSRYEIKASYAPHNNWSSAIDNQLAKSKSFTATEGDHTYEVRACNRLSCGAARSHQVQVRLAPTSPLTIDGEGVSTTGDYDLSWSAGSGTITEYELEESPAGENSWSLVQSNNSLSADIRGKAAGVYDYRLRACNEGNCGAYSEIKTVTVDRYSIPAPTAPTAATDPGVPTGSDEIGSVNGQLRVSESGAATYSVPLASAAGTAGVAPQVSINYSSQAGNGLLGLGWNLGGLGSIMRCRQSLMQDGMASAISWDENDRFCLNGQRLVVTSGDYGSAGSTYKTEVDSFVKVTAVSGSTGNPDYFTVEGKDGSITYYGDGTDVKQSVADGKVLSWAMSRFEDSVGNAITYHYHNDSGGHRIDEIRYAYGSGDSAQARIQFEYSERSDTISGFISGYQLTTKKRLTAVSSYNTQDSNESLLRRYILHYDEHASDGISRINAIEECTQGDICLPQTKFDWQLPVLGFDDATHTASLRATDQLLDSNWRSNYILDSKLVDINGDGLQDVVYVSSYVKLKKRFLSKPKVRGYQTLRYLINNGSNFTDGIPEQYNDSIEHPIKVQPLDYNGDGRQEIIVRRDNGEWELYLSVAAGDGYWSLERQGSMNFPFSSDEVTFADINGDGMVDAFDGERYWLMQRDSNQPASSNRAYHFGTGQSAYYAPNFEQDNRAWLADDIRQIAIAPLTLGNAALTNKFNRLYYDYLATRFIVKQPVGDINGDGLGDFLIQKNGYQLGLSHWDNGRFGIQSLVANAPRISDHELVHSPDLNQDGLSDIVYWSQGTGGQGVWMFQISQGDSFGAAVTLSTIDASDADEAEDNQLQFADVNRDGFPDVAWRSGTELKVLYWNNTTQQFSSMSTLRTISDDDRNTPLLLDYNGDTAIDFAEFGSYENTARFRFYAGGDANTIDASTNIGNVVTRITNGLGAVTNLSYERVNQSDHYANLEPEVSSSQWSDSYINDHSVFNDPFGDLPDDAHTLQATPLSPVLPLNGPVAVVTQVQSSVPTQNTADAMSRISYYYADARGQASGRGNLGFKQLRTVDEQTGVVTTTTYRQDWPFTGYPWKTQVRTSAGHLLSESENTWALHNWKDEWAATVQSEGSVALGALQPYIAQTEQKSYALLYNGASQGDLLSTVVTTSDYDDYGNALEVISEHYDATDSLLQRSSTVNAYGDSDYDREKGRLSEVSVETARPEQSTQTRVSRFEYQQSGDLKGLLIKEIIEPEGGNALKLTREHIYDSFGNPVQTNTKGWDGTSEVTRTGSRSEYSTYGRYADKVYQSYPSQSGEVLVTEVVGRNAYGAVTQVRDVNGNSAYSYYSPMGRKYFESSDLGGSSLSYLSEPSGLCPTGSAYISVVDNADGSGSRECFDILARSVRKLAQGFNGNWVSSDVIYDELGRAVKQSEPFYNNGGSAEAVHWREVLEYDLLDRPLRIRLPDGSESTQSYPNLSTMTTNSHGQVKTEVKNALGEVIQVTDHLGGSSYYEHDAGGNLVVMRDDANNATTIVYDSLARKLSMSDPDKGNWSYSYNAFGELISQTDGKGQVSELSYDVLGRLTNRIDKRADDSVEQTTNWSFDSQTNGLGQLAEVSDSNGYSEVPSYDNFGRNHQTTTTVPGAGSFTQAQTFDELGRLFQSFDASSDVESNGTRGLQTVYDERGFAVAVVDVRHGLDGKPLNEYQRIGDIDARGQVTRYELGNAITVNKAYNSATGLLERVNSNRFDLSNVQDVQYSWDDIGNLEYRIERSGSKDLREDFEYDGLNRLTKSTTQSNGQSIEQALTYNVLGNITYKSDVGNYSYGAGTAGPHALTQAGTVTFTYDNNGNNISSSDGRTLEYSTFDKVTKVTKGEHETTFTYSPNRSRYKRVDTNSNTGEVKTTYYLGSIERIEYSGGQRSGEREYKRSLGMAIETILYKNNEIDKQETHYLLHDHLGSIDVITDSQANIVQEMSFDAWGQRRNASSWDKLQGTDLTTFDTDITTRGYTGHEMVDGVGIIHMNGRIYDARIARFLQADPIIQEPYMTQSLNRYSYVWNNPLNATDPSGYVIDWIAFAIYAVVTAAVAYVVSDIIATAGINSGWNESTIQGLSLFVTFIAAVVTGGVVSPGFAIGGLTTAELIGVIAISGVVGGITSSLQGGKFGHGFISGGIGGFLGASSWFQGLTKGVQSLTKIIVGGTLSEITGGKFVNGAAFAAASVALGLIASGGGKDSSQPKESDNQSSIDRIKNLSDSMEERQRIYDEGVKEARDLNLDLEKVEIEAKLDEIKLGTKNDRGGYTYKSFTSKSKALTFLENNSNYFAADGVYHGGGQISIYATATSSGTKLPVVTGGILALYNSNPSVRYFSPKLSGVENVIQTIAHETGHYLGFNHRGTGIYNREFIAIQGYRDGN